MRVNSGKRMDATKYISKLKSVIKSENKLLETTQIILKQII